MAQRTLAALWQSLNPLHWPSAASEDTDQELLQVFVQTQQAAPFAALMRRHGPMVFGVCRRVLHHATDAEDAYQATFLILMRKAGSIRGPASLSSWLYQVAYRTALRARLNQRQRQAREQEVGAMRSNPEADADFGDLKAVIDEEMQRLPRKFQLPVLLCCVEGLTRSEASRQLGWREGTVGSRLARGRALLQQRLASRGVVAPAGGLGVLLAADHLQAAVPAGLDESTLQAVLHGVGAAPAAAGASAAVTGLAQAVLHETALRQLKLAGLAALLLTAVIGSGAAAVVYRAGNHQPVAAQGDPAPPAPAEPAVPPPPPVAAARVDALGDPLPDGALFRIGTTRLRHNERVVQVEFTPNGTALATSCCDGRLRFWDLATGKAAQSFAVSDQNSNAINWRSFALSPDGALAVAHFGGKLCVWEIATGKQLHALEPGYCDGLMFLPDGKTLLGVSDRLVVLWDVATGKQLREWETPANAHRAHNCALAPDGKTLALGYFDRENPRIEVWDVPSGKRLQEWKAHTDYVRQVHFTPDGQHLISLGWDDTIILWKAATGAEVRRWTVKRCITTAVAPVGRTLAFVTHKNELKLVNWETGADVRTMPCEALGGQLAFSADSKVLVQAGQTVRFWDVATGAEKNILPGLQTHVQDVGFHTDGRTLVSREDKTLRLRDPATGKELRTFADFDSYLASPDGRTLAFLKRAAANADDQKAEQPFTIRLVDFASARNWPVGKAKAGANIWLHGRRTAVRSPR